MNVLVCRSRTTSSWGHMSSIILELWCNLSKLFYHQMLKKLYQPQGNQSYHRPYQRLKVLILSSNFIQYEQYEQNQQYKQFYKFYSASWGRLLAFLQRCSKPKADSRLGVTCVQLGLLAGLKALLLPENQIPFCQLCSTWLRMGQLMSETFAKVQTDFFVGCRSTLTSDEI